MKALALVLVLAACGGGKDPVTPDPDAPVIPPDGPLPDLPPPRETKMSTVPMEVGEVIEAKMIGGAADRAIIKLTAPAMELDWNIHSHPNGTTINEKLRSESSAVARAITRNDSDRAIVDRLFLAALSRRPTPPEQDRMVKALRDSIAGLADPKAIATARREAAEDLYWAILTCREFLFNH